MIIKRRGLIAYLLMFVVTLLISFLLIKSHNFDLNLVIITSVLSFLFFYKILDYTANFKTLKNKSRIDIVFLFIFFVWLLVPMSHINKKTRLVMENRERAPKPSFVNLGNVNYSYGEDFNKWFNDRFLLRDALVHLYNQISLGLTHKTTQGYIDKDWLYSGFYKPNSTIPTANTDAVLKLNNFCKQNNIKLYFLVVPYKNNIYLSSKSNVLINKSHKNFVDTLSNYNGKLNIIYPYDQLERNKSKEYMFFKTEHHWTDDGAFIGYKELMKSIKQDFPNVKIRTASDYTYFYNNLVRGDFNREFGIGTSYRVLGLSKKGAKRYHKTPYRYFKYKNFNKMSCKIEDIPMHKRKEYYYPYGTDLRVILLGTSQNENLCEFIPFTFKHVKRIRNNNVAQIKRDEEWKIMKYYKNEILEYKPDILIFGITEENLKDKNFSKLFEE